MEYSGDNDNTAPPPDVVEVSVFGPGFGECVVIHAGENDWFVVDSCIDPEANLPVAIAYLNRIGVDPKNAIRAVIASHWDDDHTAGLGEVFRIAETAKFVCSGALTSAEFKSIVANWRLKKHLPFGSGVDEIDMIFEEIYRRKSSTRTPMAILATHNKVLWERPGAELRSLSPSDAGTMAATVQFSEMLKTQPQLSGRMPRIEGNHASVVLSLRVGETTALFGGDLQHRADRSHGWYAIIDQFNGAKHAAYKIPHHGSENGDNDEIWGKLLDVSPPAAVTPFVNGAHRLPGEIDCKRIFARTAKSFVTAPPVTKKLRLQSQAADKMVKEFSLQAHVVPGRFGQVRMRASIGSNDWQTDLFGDATTVEALLRRASEIWPTKRR